MNTSLHQNLAVGGVSPPGHPRQVTIRSPYPLDRLWPLEAAALLATLFEATAPKLGNVHPGAAFEDMDYSHFVMSSNTIGPVFAQANASPMLSVGALVLECVIVTRQQIGRNTNLGTLLLFGPLAIAFNRSRPETLGAWRAATAQQLAQLNHSDSQAIYAAIRYASPGGLGTAAKHDVQQAAPDCLVTAMREVAESDAVARQYTNGFADIFERLLPWFEEALHRCPDVFTAICELQLRWLAHEPDGLIMRKAGREIAGQVQDLAVQALLEQDPPKREQKLSALDAFLRDDGHKRNPGTTADLIAATLLVRLMCREA